MIYLCGERFAGMEFVIAVLGISLIIGFAAMLLWKKDSPQWKAFPGFYTFLPAAICIIAALILTNELSLGDFSFTKFDLGYMTLAVGIPVMFYLISMLIQTAFRSYVLKDAIEWKQIILAVLINFVVVIVFVAGEEIGWRGFIQNRLIEQYGIAGIGLLGLVWGIWHAPIALRGHNLSKYFWAEAFILYPYVCICYSFPLAFLTIQSGSIWPALLFHAMNNSLGSVGSQIMERKKPVVEIVLLILTGTLLAIPFALLLLR